MSECTTVPDHGETSLPWTRLVRLGVAVARYVVRPGSLQCVPTPSASRVMPVRASLALVPPSLTPGPSPQTRAQGPATTHSSNAGRPSCVTPRPGPRLCGAAWPEAPEAARGPEAMGRGGGCPGRGHSLSVRGPQPHTGNVFGGRSEGPRCTVYRNDPRGPLVGAGSPVSGGTGAADRSRSARGRGKRQCGGPAFCRHCGGPCQAFSP